jgi:diadenosine tetraphosphate (Ap4A) HIT family hydrolase
MPTLFTRIIQGELPGRFVWRDELAVAFLTLRPIHAGHTLVVPRLEVDHWIDLPDGLAAHLIGVAQRVGAAIQRAFSPRKVGVMIAGLEVPHTHLHLIPIHALGDLNFANERNASAEELDLAAQKLRIALKELGHREVAS